MCKPMVARTAGDEPVQWSSDGDTGMKRWSNAVLFHPADKSRHPCPFLASASVLRWIFFSLGQCIALRSFSYRMHTWICPEGASLWIWLERVCLERPSEKSFEFGQLTSSWNRPLQSWSSPARNILLLDPLKLWNKTLELYVWFTCKTEAWVDLK